MAVSVTSNEDERNQFADVFRVKNAQDGFTYRWLNTNPRNIAQKTLKGYQIVQTGDPEEILLSDATPIKKGAALDGTKCFSDVVLARCPTEKWEQGREKNQRRIDRLTAMIVRDYDKEAGPLGFNPRRDPTGAATRYATGTTEKGFDKAALSDQEFEGKWGMPKASASEEE
jgi:hypothetical protein